MKERTRIQRQLHSVLWKFNPHLFDIREPKPLAIGVDKEIKALLPELRKRDLQSFLAWWTKRFGYLYAMRDGYVRFHINGSKASVITEEEREHAGRVIEGRKNKSKRRGVAS